MLWFSQTFPFASNYAASWAAAQLDGEALMMLDDEGLRDDIPIGVRAHRGIILKKINALRIAAENATTAPALLANGPASSAVAGIAAGAGAGATAGLNAALAVAKRELAATQEENAALREALAGDTSSTTTSTPLLLGQGPGLSSSSAGAGSSLLSPPASSSTLGGGAPVRLSIRKPAGDYIKMEVGEQTLIAELKAELSGLTGMPLRTQVCDASLSLPRCSVHVLSPWHGRRTDSVGWLDRPRRGAAAARTGRDPGMWCA